MTRLWGLIFLLAQIDAFAIDGVLEINQVSVNSTEDTLHVIDQPGSYILTSNLVAPEDDDGIVITANNVTLDLNGFYIYGSGLQLRDGIAVSGADVEVRDGTIRGFGRHGIYSEGDRTRIIDIRTFDNAFAGFRLEFADGGLVKDSVSGNNEGAGMRAVSPGVMIEGNVVIGNAGIGLQLSNFAAYGGNVLKDNNDGVGQITGGQAVSCNLVDSTLDCPP